MLDFILCQCCVLELPPDEPPWVKQTVEVFLTGINFISVFRHVVPNFSLKHSLVPKSRLLQHAGLAAALLDVQCKRVKCEK